MSILSFGVLATLLTMLALFFTDPFREHVCAPLVRRLVAKRQAEALRQATAGNAPKLRFLPEDE